MYDKNSTRMDYYRNCNIQQHENYDDDFKLFTKEAQVSDDKF